VRSSAIIDRVAALLERTPPFDRLPPEDRQRILGDLLIEYFEGDEVILEQGRTRHEFLYVVESGFVRLLDTQTQILVEECGEGDIFGIHGLIRRGALPYEARAVEPTVCLLLRASRFQRLYADHESFAAFFESGLQRYNRASKLPLDASSARLLFGTRLGEIVHRGPVILSPETTAREAARVMRRESADSAVLVRDGKILGILSDIDLRNKLVAEGTSFETPIEELMNEDAIRLRANAPVFEALMEMLQRRAYHVIVTENGSPEASPVGIVSDQDISRAQGASPAFVLERVERARTLDELSRLRVETTALLVGLDRQGVQPEDLIAINTEANDRIMRRALSLVEAELKEESPELVVDLPWAWVSLGSEGRGEMSLLTDQDNALVYANPQAPEEADRAEEWFRTLAERANLALAEVGFALCKGDVMARNPKWRKGLSAWEETFRAWILSPEAYALMEAGIFFDLRGLYGDRSLVEQIKSSIASALREERRFLPFLARNALADRPAPSFFRRFLAERGRQAFDIKRRGIRPLVDIARLFAMQTGYLDSTNTADRLRHARMALPDMAPSAENALDAYNYLMEFRFRHHLRAIERGEMPENRIEPSTLSRAQQSMLNAVFSTVEGVQDEVANRYGAGTT
jgi:CBS domain-containing protein